MTGVFTVFMLINLPIQGFSPTIELDFQYHADSLAIGWIRFAMLQSFIHIYNEVNKKTKVIQPFFQKRPPAYSIGHNSTSSFISDVSDHDFLDLKSLELFAVKYIF
jgi:hypothetical protein